MRLGRHEPLYQSIILTVGVYGVLGLLSVFLLSWIYALPTTLLFTFVVVQSTYHSLVAFLLILGSGFFRFASSGEKLQKINAANKVTLVRISMVPALLFLILALERHPVGPVLVVAIALTFLTDLVDGRVSRAGNQVTVMGKILDSVGDYSLLLVVAFAYRTYDLLPAWLFFVILFRLFFQAFGMLILLLTHKWVEPRPTILGKAMVAAIMVLFAVEPLKVLFPELSGPITTAEWIVGSIVAVSVIDKGWYFLNYRRISESSRTP